MLINSLTFTCAAGDIPDQHLVQERVAAFAAEAIDVGDAVSNVPLPQDGAPAVEAVARQTPVMAAGLRSPAGGALSVGRGVVSWAGLVPEEPSARGGWSCTTRRTPCSGCSRWRSLPRWCRSAPGTCWAHCRACRPSRGRTQTRRRTPCLAARSQRLCPLHRYLGARARTCSSCCVARCLQQNQHHIRSSVGNRQSHIKKGVHVQNLQHPTLSGGFIACKR
jgi:hypothetical protein